MRDRPAGRWWKEPAPRRPAGRAPAQTGALLWQSVKSRLHDAVDLLLRFIERFLRLLLPDQRRLDGGGHGVADRRPLRHARAPVDVGVLVQGLQSGFGEALAGLAEELGVLGVAPER